MIKQGSFIKVLPFEFTRHLAGGAVIKPPQTLRHDGCKCARVVELFDDLDEPQVEFVGAYGDVDYAPLSACRELLTVAQAATLKGVHEETVRRLIRAGEFKHVQSVGAGQRKVWLLDADEIEAWQPRPAYRPPQS